MSSNPLTTDFARSNLYFETDHSKHTARLVLDGTCHITKPGESQQTFHLTSPCIAEKMYAETDLIHEPVATFNLIAEEEGELMLLKHHANGKHDVREPMTFGDTLPTHDGKGATMKRLSMTLRQFDSVEPITNAKEFQEALQNNGFFNARTQFTDPTTGYDVVMEYPCKTVNARLDQSSWQIDAGPVLMPNGDKPRKLTVDHLDLAFVVANRFDYFEAVIRSKTPVERGGTTGHYNIRRRLDCQTELFVAFV